VAYYEIPKTGRLEYDEAPPRGRRWLTVLLIVLAAALLGARTIASYVVEYNWWREMEQVPTWIDLLIYSFAPVAAAALLAFGVLFTAHARGLKFAGTRLGHHRFYAKMSTLALLLVSVVLAAATIDTWTVVRYFGGRNLPVEATAFRDSVFAQPLGFYLFDLPFYSVLRGFVLGVVIVAALAYWLTARGWQLRDRISDLQQATELDIRILGLKGALESRFLRGIGAAFLIALAFQFFLGRYQMVWNSHGFMVGIDYVDEKLALPLQWLVIAACVAGAAAVAIGRWKWAAVIVVALIVKAAVPGAVRAIYVRPNEISIQRPYIEKHIHATRNAFGLEQRVREVEFAAELEGRFNPADHQAILDNVRLWDWRAFHDTVSQIQALRPYYTFADSDVDRYVIDGRLRQVLLSPRELDMRQLPADARARWINPSFIYTHGYGLVLAEANRITAEGLPVLFIQDAPPTIRTDSLKLTRPELYYSEVTHEPVFVNTAQPEFNYPSGADNVFSKYQGRGGFPVSSFAMRLTAAISEAAPNIILTGYLTPDSRMMIRRDIKERLRNLAAFIRWDPDPYLVVTEEGRMVFTVDGYTTSDAHPYSQSLNVAQFGEVNYIRNAVKATVDAYDGTTRIYIFDPTDPIIRAYQRLFPQLLLPFSEMPADLRAHARYPELLFRVQAEMYRTFHMRDPQAFYNKEDLWDIPRSVRGQGGRPEPMSPSYVVASLPGENRPEFLLMIPFTPRNKDNMIGLMVARCDGEHLGEMVMLQLSKQELIFGPMQIEARINQDQLISKDLNLWNQQGSQVLRGNLLVLPVADTFMYVMPIYIQAAEARMPQLKKVAVAVGNNLIYEDTYDQALVQLSRVMQGAPRVQQAAAAAPAPAPSQPSAAPPAPQAPPAVSPDAQRRLESIRDHLRRYRELVSQGRWSEAGKELEAIESEVGRR
jgi:uncharacterized membrane protein (UPF0182 family)